MQTFVTERAWAKEELEYYVERAEADLEAKMKAQETEEEKEQFRYFPEYMEKAKEIVEAERTAEAEAARIKAAADEDKAVTGTQSQSNSAGFATRMQESSSVFDELESQIVALNAWDLTVLRGKPNWLKPEWFQRQEQAERNFVNAQLRKESTDFIDAHPEIFSGSVEQQFMKKAVNIDNP